MAKDYLIRISEHIYKLRPPVSIWDRLVLSLLMGVLFILSPIVFQAGGRECGGEIKCTDSSGPILCTVHGFRAPFFSTEPAVTYSTEFPLNGVHTIQVKNQWAKHTGNYYQLGIMSADNHWLAGINAMNSPQQLQALGDALKVYKRNPGHYFGRFVIEPYSYDYIACFAAIVMFLLPIFAIFNRITTYFDTSANVLRVTRKLAGVTYLEKIIPFDAFSKFYPLPSFRGGNCSLMLEMKNGQSNFVAGGLRKKPVEFLANELNERFISTD